jgi:2-desacetyl-2-hydroxyethyl bacteriochlorophyllide A dehydrogenase
MKAIVRHSYGSPDILELQEIPKPIPGANQILIKVLAASVNAGDWHLLRADPFLIRLMGFGLLKPKYRILGSDIAGHVEQVGGNAKRLKPGDEVFGDLSGSGFGAFAEYVCVPEDAVVPKPLNATFEEAAAVPVSALAALHALRDRGRTEAGQRVLINGASGGVGTFAVQLAKALGAEVTAVCSTRNLDLVRSIGADEAIDYTQEDFTRSGRQYDLIVDAAAFRSVADYVPALSPGGTYVMVGGSVARMFQAMALGPWVSITSDKRVTSLISEPDKDDLTFVKELIEAGKIKPVIDRRYSLSEVPEAIRYIEKGHARGKVVISM